MLSTDSDNKVNIHNALLDSTAGVLQLFPEEVETENFTYYDLDVQNRLENVVEKIINEQAWTPESPMIILNPYGTASNGVLVYFENDQKCKVSYTIHVDNPEIPDYTATVPNEGEQGYSKEQKFQIIGLVPGEMNEVKLTLTSSLGRTQKEVSFQITMPEPTSGYQTKLEMKEGESTQELSNGLFSLMRVNGTLGYVFFFDNAGILRYEMVLEGYGMDRILEHDGNMVTSVSAKKIAQIDRFGHVEQLVDLGKYTMHHDLCLCESDKLLVLAEDDEDKDVSVEDLVLEVDLKTAEVSLVVDFKEVMKEYYKNDTRAITATDTFFWQEGERDWIHLNSIVWMEEDDSIIVSSRKTSTIIKVENIHDEQNLAYFIGDERFWEGTGYEEYCYSQAGEKFLPQYGQHDVALVRDSTLEDGCYYLTLYNNNYWALSSRQDNYEPSLDNAVGTEFYGGEDVFSYVYTYLVDENKSTYELIDSFAVPYSSIVSNADFQGNGNIVVNSGMASVYGEYDEDGKLIYEYQYTSTMQNYRVFKDDFTWLWFSDARR